MQASTWQLLEVRDGKPIKLWTEGVLVESEARQQLINTAKMPFIFKHLAVMPDVHLGKGSTIGSVIPTVGAIIPAAVGVDIGCGMIAARTTLTAADLPDNLHALRSAIEKAVPHGRTLSRGRRDEGAWHNVPKQADQAWAALDQRFKAITAKYPKLASTNNRHHLGTLGSGNHFIEVCLDEADRVWFMLHSGSRGVGNDIGNLFIQLAQADMRQHLANLPDRDLAYFKEGSRHFADYVDAVGWAQDFARQNRALMMQAVIGAARQVIRKPFEVALEAFNIATCQPTHITTMCRRSSISARTCGSPARARCRRKKASLGSFPAPWGRKASSSAAWAMSNRSAPAATAPAAP